MVGLGTLSASRMSGNPPLGVASQPWFILVRNEQNRHAVRRYRRRSGQFHAHTHKQPRPQTITSVVPLHVGQFMFCRIETDGGLVGYGEAGCWGQIKPAGTAIEHFATYLIGKSAFTIEHHWNVSEPAALPTPGRRAEARR